MLAEIIANFFSVPMPSLINRRRINEVTIMDLPTDIMVVILTKLPIKPVFRCKIVCKSWYNLFSDPLFLNMYYRRSSSNFPCILFSIEHSIASLLELKADYNYYSHPENRPIVLNPKFHLPPSGFGFCNPKLKVIGSCNGFICLLNDDRFHAAGSLYISNPLLGEYFTVKLPKRGDIFRRIAYTFCFSEGSGEYKLLRSVVKMFESRPVVSVLEVYTLGVDEEWRDVGEAPYPLCGFFGNANVNGHVHWVNRDKRDSIYSFNIRAEEVKSLSAPRGLETPSNCLKILELGNCLCLYDNRYMKHVDIWWMKEYGIAESWTKDRILFDCIPRDICDARYIPIVIWKDGEILMQRDRGGKQLASYNPKEKKFRKVDVYVNGTTATRYIPNFYSIKTVMGDKFQVSNVYQKTQIVYYLFRLTSSMIICFASIILAIFTVFLMLFEFW